MKEELGCIRRSTKRIEEKWEGLVESTKKSEKALKMTRKKDSDFKDREFEGEAREQRRKVWKCLKKYLQTKR